MSEYTAEMAHAAAARGASWLDEKCPGWEERIDLEALRLEDAAACVLGQVADCLIGQQPAKEIYKTGYWRVADSELFRAESFSMSWAGFELPYTADREDRNTGYEMLTIAWSSLIRERLAVPV